ncbi:MAG: hypothetical protein JST80_05320 [Bdellovibrionales bacterium]|nr:hypothetical protein [Bdellovibrionales bacterium]
MVTFKFARSRAVIRFAILTGLTLAIPAFAQTPTPTPVPVPKFKRVVWVWLENTPYATTMTQRYLKSVWQRYPSVRFSKFLPVSKVTQADAFAAISGSDWDIADNEVMKFLNPTIVDLLESKSISWRVYAEDFIGACFLGDGAGSYKRYRVPFMSVAKVQSDRYLCSKVVGFRNYDSDMLLGSLPQVSFVIPNLVNSGATTNPGYADDAVKRLINPIVTNPDLLNDTTIIVSTINNADPKRLEMYLLMVGKGISSAAQTVATPYNVYHVLRTVEDGLRLGHLNQNDAKVDPILGFWQE